MKNIVSKLADRPTRKDFPSFVTICHRREWHGFKADLISELQETITVALLACMRFFGIESDEGRTDESGLDARNLKILKTTWRASRSGRPCQPK